MFARKRVLILIASVGACFVVSIIGSVAPALHKEAIRIVLNAVVTPALLFAVLAWLCHDWSTLCCSGRCYCDSECSRFQPCCWLSSKSGQAV